MAGEDEPTRLVIARVRQLTQDVVEAALVDDLPRVVALTDGVGPQLSAAVLYTLVGLFQEAEHELGTDGATGVRRRLERWSQVAARRYFEPD